MFATEKKIFYINSKNRLVSTAKSCDFTYGLKIPQDAKYDSVCVLSASIPKSFYLVQAPNNTFTLTEGKTSYTCTIPPGNYELKTFMAVLETELDAQGGWTYAVTTQDTQTEADLGKFVISVAGNSGEQPSITFPSATLMHEIMGFAKESTNTFVEDSLTSTNCYNLNRETTLYLRSNIVDEDEDVLVEVFSSASPDFSSITYQCSAQDLYSKRMRNKGTSYNFKLTNEDGVLIDLNGQDIQLTICCYKAIQTLGNIDRFIASTIMDQLEQRKTEYQQRVKDAETRPPDQVITEDAPLG